MVGNFQYILTLWPSTLWPHGDFRFRSEMVRYSHIKQMKLARQAITQSLLPWLQLSHCNLGETDCDCYKYVFKYVWEALPLNRCLVLACCLAHIFIIYIAEGFEDFSVDVWSILKMTRTQQILLIAHEVHRDVDAVRTARAASNIQIVAAFACETASARHVDGSPPLTHVLATRLCIWIWEIAQING